MARRQARARQVRLSPEWIAQASRVIQDSVANLPEFQSARRIGLYLAQPREVQTRDLLEKVWTSGRRAAVPAWDARRQGYRYAWLDAGQPTQPGAYGILEPSAPTWVGPDELDLLIVPCVAFDLYGRRLGHGGGHFDRLMSRQSGPRLCIAFEGQRLTAVPFEPHDVALDIIVTERAVYDARSPAG